MSGESTMRGNVVKWLRLDRQDPISVENPVYPGTPDVNYKGGWIELKRRVNFSRSPGHADRIVTCSHFTKEQKVWLFRRWRAGGRAHLLWQIGTEWFLFDGVTAHEVVGSCTEQVLRERALVVWKGNAAVKEELTQWLYA